MVRTVLHAAVALALASTATVTAGASRCAHLDPAGDVTLTEHGPVVDAPHVDLLDVDMAASKHELDVVVRTVGSGREGVWRVTFTAGGKRLYAFAALAAIVGSPLDPETRHGAYGGVVGGTATGGVATWDMARHEVRIYVPLTAFRGALRPRGRITAVETVAKQKLVTTGGTDVSYVDRATGLSRCA